MIKTDEETGSSSSLFTSSVVWTAAALCTDTAKCRIGRRVSRSKNSAAPRVEFVTVDTVTTQSNFSYLQETSTAKETAVNQRTSPQTQTSLLQTQHVRDCMAVNTHEHDVIKIITVTDV